MDVKLIKKLLDIYIKCEEFEMALQHQSKVQFYRELNKEIGFEEYLQYIKEITSRFFLKFNLDTCGLFEELGRHAKGGGGCITGKSYL